MTKHINLAKVAFLLLFIASLTASAQGLPALKMASEITVGELPNGISYYLVTNQTAKGYADFALVQKGQTSPVQAREAITELPHFQKKSPYHFLSQHGVGYRDIGYIDYTSCSTVYRFENVPTHDRNVSDTTLLMLFDICERSPFQQAVIISGDITPAAIKEKMSVFSMMVTPRKPAAAPDEYVWKETDTLRSRFVHSPQCKVSGVTATYLSPRTPRANMNTVQPLVSEMFALAYGTVAEDRVRSSFRSLGIPVADVRAEYVSSAATPDDEKYRITVYTSDDRLEAATEALGSILADLDRNGATSAEYAHAREIYISNSVKAAQSRKLTNGQYVDKCISAYLYGSNLASAKTLSDLVVTRAMEPEKELALFNNFVSAFLDREKNLVLQFTSPDEDRQISGLVDAFRNGWTGGTSFKASRERNYGDSLSLFTPNPKVKVKIKNEADEPMTGGRMWTFSNGMKVIYKQADTKGKFNYAFMIKGGYASVRDLGQGEGGFVEDMLGLYDIGGLTAQDFRDMLKANAITMYTHVNLSDLRLVGSAPSSKLSLLLKSVLTIANERTLNKSAFEYYRRSEALRLELVRRQQEGIFDVVDSLMCPDYRYRATRYAAALGDDLPERAEEYFRSQFSRFNDGVVILIGDLDANAVKKMLTRYLGGFVTGNQYSFRPPIRYSLRSGWSTYTIDADASYVGEGDPSLSVAVSTLMPFTADRYMAFKIATIVVERAVVETLADCGLYAEFYDDYEVYPHERLNLKMTFRPASQDGLPDDVVPMDPLAALGHIRVALGKATSEPVSEARLKVYKASLLNDLESHYTTTSDLMDATLSRYSDGKDLVTKYKDKVNAVNAEAVMEVLKAFKDGSKVEYLIF